MILLDDTNRHFSFDAAIPPAAYADSGEAVRVLCRDCYDGQLIRDGMDFRLLDMTRGNPVTGPLYIRNARPGDTLRVDILAIEPGEAGVMCLRPGKGIYAVEGCHCRRFPIRDGMVRFDRDLAFPLRPMIGVLGAAPAGAPVDTHTPGEHGGNMDIRELGAGASLYLPVAVPGALLSLGDLHGLQGDGETAICGLEMGGAVTLRATVIPGGAGLPTPFLVTETALYTTAADPSLDVCGAAAARKMHAFLLSRGLTDAQAAMLLSLRGHLRVAQVVNPRKGCLMELPRDGLESLLKDPPLP